MRRGASVGPVATRLKHPANVILRGPAPTGPGAGGCHAAVAKHLAAGRLVCRRGERGRGDLIPRCGCYELVALRSPLFLHQSKHAPHCVLAIIPQVGAHESVKYTLTISKCEPYGWGVGAPCTVLGWQWDAGTQDCFCMGSTANNCSPAPQMTALATALATAPAWPALPTPARGSASAVRAMAPRTAPWSPLPWSLARPSARSRWRLSAHCSSCRRPPVSRRAMLLCHLGSRGAWVLSVHAGPTSGCSVLQAACTLGRNCTAAEYCLCCTNSPAEAMLTGNVEVVVEASFVSTHYPHTLEARPSVLLDQVGGWGRVCSLAPPR